MTHDENIDQLLANHCAEHEISQLDAIKLFPVLARRQWLKRFLAHAELFKLTLEVPGDIVELGVYRGAGLFAWANLLETYCIGDRTKIVYGIDNWEGFTSLSDFDHKSKNYGDYSPAEYFDELLSAMKIFDADRFMPSKDRIILAKMNINTENMNKFLEDHPGMRISLLHFDCDMYWPTKEALEALWPLVSRGGIVMFDEYGIAEWPGETKAVDEFLEDKPELKLKTVPWTNTPAAYLVKP